MIDFIKKLFLKFISWIMSIKSVSTMVLVVFGLITFGYFLCEKNISPQTIIDIYKDITSPKIIEVDSVFVKDTIVVAE